MGISGTRFLPGKYAWSQVPFGVDVGPRGGYPTPSPWTWDLGYHGIRSASGRYTSYWYAFLLINNFNTNLGLKISSRVRINTCLALWLGRGEWSVFLLSFLFVWLLPLTEGLCFKLW